MTNRGIAAGLALLLVFLGACGGDDDSDDATGGAADDPTTTTSASTTTTEAAGDAVSTEEVEVFFLDVEQYNTGASPFIVPVAREVDADDAPRGALEALFAGPTSDEQQSGLEFVDSKASGFSAFNVERRTALVQLAGGCSSGGSTVTVASLIQPTLKQFPEIDAVKIYDPEGRTLAPDVPGDSTPECLEP